MPPRLVRRTLVGFVLAVAAACGSAPDTSGPTSPPFTVGMQVKMNGLVKGVVVPVLNVWNTVPPSEPVCTLQHGAVVTITASKYNPGDSRWYFNVDSGGSCAGWVPETSLKK
jgi:hypothetical protein